MLAVTVMAACKQNPETTTDETTVDTMALVAESEAPEAVEEQPSEPVKAQQSNYFDSKANKAAQQHNAVAAKPATKGKAETIYVETDDSRGRVWGHVTMKGDRGTGTVHDEGENTWAVTVTRHGNELYAVDQNSRQYVFKLKQNKTQE